MPVKNQDPTTTLGILYSFRRCPYAMRARMALKYCGIRVDLREIELKSKPQQMLLCSAKGTVPVLALADGTIIDESRDIMLWALSLCDPEHWQTDDSATEINRLLNDNDYDFKQNLDRYKYADRYPQHSAGYYRSQGEQFLTLIEEQLKNNRFLVGDKVSMADIGIFPFIRQFALVDKDWFYQSSYHHLQAWLDYFLESELFISVMQKYPPWAESSEPVIF